MTRPLLLCAMIAAALLMPLAGCSAQVSLPAIVPPTPTGTPCAYTENPGPPPPEVERQAQLDFINLGADGIHGDLRVEAEGEYQCEQFHVRSVSFNYTVVMPDLQDQARMAAYAEKLTASARKSVQRWNLGEVRVRFISGQECRWDASQGACGPIEPLSSP